MEEIIKIEGNYKLQGSVRISGSKNATVALIPASILANGPVTVCGVPDISDVHSLSVLLEDLGVEVTMRNHDTIIIDPSKMQNRPLVHDAVNKLRASYYFMGALLGKYGHVEIKMPGGCYLGPRPIDLHLKGFEALGAKISYDHGAYILDAVDKQLIGARIFLDISSVGATINIMMAAVHAKGRTTIENAAKEPEIIDVATLLNKMGANIRGTGTNVITIDGVDELNGCFHEIIPDRIEAATYIIIAAAVANDMIIENIIPHHLEALISKLKEIGIQIEDGVDSLRIRSSNNLVATDIKTLPYPGFATDIQQPLSALLTQAQGQSIITETIYTERFKHCQELNKMGASINVMTPNAFISGPSELCGAEVLASDLRCGASLIVAGLLAKGITSIRNIYHIERGYEHIDEKLQALGAHIWRENIDN